MSIEKMNYDFGFLKTEKTKVAKTVNRSLSPLMVAKTDLVKGVQETICSVSTFHKEYRKSPEKLNKFLSEAQAKGRLFDAKKIHGIINEGDLKPITAADTVLQAAKLHPATKWSSNRYFQAFVKATEIK